jgi:hypothetical protein
LAVPIPDLTEIAKAHKIEYTVKTGSREIKGSLLVIFRTFSATNLARQEA